MILGVSPLRISFAGGGTDMPEYYEKYGGNVVTTCIDKFTYVIINPRHDNLFQAFSSDFQTHHPTTSYGTLKPKNGTEIAVAVVKYLDYKKGANFLIASDVSPGSGLGASSSLTVNFIKTILTLQGKNRTNEKIAETAFYIDRHILRHPIGKQDEYVAAFGGFNFIKFEKDKTSVHPIIMKKNTLSELEQNLLLFFAGGRGKSRVLSTQIKRIEQSIQSTMDSMHYVKQLAQEMHRSLVKSDLTSVGTLLHKGWLAKKNFAPGVSNDFIDKVYEAALKQGAMGGKLTGAGGGGHMLLYCEASKQKLLIKKLESLGLRQVQFHFHQEGPKVLNMHDFSK